MPHAIHVDGSMVVLRDEWSSPGSMLRVFRTSGDDALVVTATLDATCDGVPLLGDLTIVRWGRSAVLRVDGRKVEIRWHACGERRRPRRGERCRLCLGRFVTGDAADGDEDVAGAHDVDDVEVVACVCLAVFHSDCDTVRVNCPACGLSPDEQGEGEA